MEHFAEWLLRELNNRGLRPNDIAKQAGLGSGTISHILNGTRRPGPEVCRAIAKVLGISEEKVFREAGLLSPLATVEDDPTLREIWDIVKRMSYEDRQEVYNYVRYRLQLEDEQTHSEGNVSNKPAESGV